MHTNSPDSTRPQQDPTSAAKHSTEIMASDAEKPGMYSVYIAAYTGMFGLLEDGPVLALFVLA